MVIKNEGKLISRTEQSGWQQTHFFFPPNFSSSESSHTDHVLISLWKLMYVKAICDKRMWIFSYSCWCYSYSTSSFAYSPFHQHRGGAVKIPRQLPWVEHWWSRWGPDAKDGVCGYQYLWRWLPSVCKLLKYSMMWTERQCWVKSLLKASMWFE